MRRSRLPLALLPLLLVTCSPRPQGRTNLVLIVVDSLRQDALGHFGAPIPTSPHVDALAAQGVSLESSYTVSPWTLPSVATIFTGLPPTAHGAIDPRKTLAPEAETLAEILKDAGYRTAGVVSHMFLKARYGMDQGFERFQDSESRGHDYVSSPGVTQQAIDSLREMAGGPAPFFLFVHYFDPHFAYIRHPEYGLATGPPGRLKGGEGAPKLLALAPTLTPDELKFLLRVYAEEIRTTDEGIGALLREMETLGVSDSTLVVFTADHGEEFCSRDDWIGHTIGLYEEDLRVPLVMRDSKAARPGRVERGATSVVDLLPTALELLGVPIPDGVAGESFASTIREGRPLEPRDLHFEVDFEPLSAAVARTISHKRGILRDGWKFIRDEMDGAIELYDLRTDPGELRNVAAENPERRDELAGRLAAFSKSASAGGFAAGNVVLTEGQVERLRALGYAGDR